MTFMRINNTEFFFKKNCINRENITFSNSLSQIFSHSLKQTLFFLQQQTHIISLIIVSAI